MSLPFSRTPSLAVLALLAALAAACSDDEGGSGGSAAEGGGPSSSTSSSGGGGSGAGFATSTTTTSSGGDPCAFTTCDPGLACVVDEGEASCVPLTCQEAACSPTEACEILANGGAVCVDISCTEDLECLPAEHCNGTICVADVCIAGETACTGDALFECASNGSALVSKATCGSQAYFVSMCVDDGMGAAFCGCRDDWDCPEYMSCEAGQCAGTGVAPTCSLPPVPFENALPVNEIQWGGTGSGSPANQAVNAPFPLSSQVSMTPVVANLDDDNGDGLVDERDFPEVIFMTYCGTDISVNGVVRAIHGGGPAKGTDYFASCGGTTWKEGDPLSLACPCADAIGNSTASLAVGDLDGDGVPEIVVPNETAGLTILDNTGAIITSSPPNQWASFPNPAVAIANLDNAGFAELVVGHRAFSLEHDAGGNLVFLDRFDGNLMSGRNGQGPVSCVANIAGDVRPEIVAGSTAYRLPEPPTGVTKRSECPMGATDDFCAGILSVVWDGQTVNGATLLPSAQRDGFCAVADVLGMDPALAPSPSNPLDDLPEVVLVSGGYLVVLDGATGTRLRFINLNAGTNGGPPNVDDFDGDGFPEIGTAFGLRYLMIDLQDASADCPIWPNAFADTGTGLQGNPARAPGGACSMDADCAGGAVCNLAIGACTCLHNGWARVTEDDSSRVTSSSVFDFNGDGAAEVVYNDECFFRVYDGAEGSVLFKQNSPSRTRIENPVIADVDNDGNAEIVFCSNNDASSCTAGSNHPNGIQVWGDATDSWVSARRIYNQHAYHVTNVTEGGGIPQFEPESWKDWNGRRYNTYRSNPRSLGIAPDLTVSAVQFSSPGEQCGVLSTDLEIAFEIRNEGDVRVGPGVVVRFEGTWNAASVTEPLYANLAATTPLELVLQSSIEPGQSIVLSVAYDAMQSSQGTLPDSVRVIVDALGAESECREDNNDRTEPVVGGDTLPDLVVSLGAVSGNCPPAIATAVSNVGTAAASGVVVRFFAGNPQQSGTPILDLPVPGSIAPGQTITFNPAPVLTGFPGAAFGVTIYAVVDPDKLVPECNEANNIDAAEQTVTCAPQ